MVRSARRTSAKLTAIPAVLAAGLVGLVGCAGAQAATPRQLSDLGPTSVLGGSLPQLGDVHLMGVAPGSTSATALVALQHRDEAGLLSFVANVSDPHSAQYEHYLTAQQFDAAYAPTDATVASVERYLTSFGLKVQSVPTNHAYVVVDGNVGEMVRAFATKIDLYIKDGEIFHSPVSTLNIPASLSGVITGVTGLNNGDIATPQISSPGATAPAAASAASASASAAPATTTTPVATTTTGTETSALDTPPYPAYVNSAPFSTYFNSSMATQAPGYGGASVLGNVVEGYTPQQIEGAYGISGAIADGLNGTGETVAVIDAYSSPTIQSDIEEWSALHDLPKANLEIDDTLADRIQPDAPAVPTDVPVLGGADLLDPSGWFGEETLDIEAVHTMAPEAKIIEQAALSPEDATLEMAQNTVVENDVAQEVSNSYAGTGDSTDTTTDGYWVQAAAEGMGVQFSTGDDGDNTDGETDLAGQSVDTDPNSPYVTAVGGTTLAIGAKNNYEWETYWGDNTATLANGQWGTVSSDGGGGGGVSQVYAEPSWQQGVVPDAIADYWKTYTPQSAADDAALPACTTGETPAADDCAVYPGRAMPDVAMLADPNTGFQLGLSEDYSVYDNPDAIALPTDTAAYGQFRIGGTSLASPLFAGMMALADQANGKPLGFADPALYATFKSDSTAFHAIDTTSPVVGVVRTNYTNSVNSLGGTTTVLRTFDNPYTLSTAAGYNDSTGLGSPNGMTFICALSGDSALAKSVAGSPCAAKAVASTCTVAKTLSYAQHPAASTREIAAVVYVNGKRVKTIRSKRITRVAITRPKATKFTVRYVATLANGEVVAHQYTYNGCRTSKQVVTELHKPRTRSVRVKAKATK